MFSKPFWFKFILIRSTTTILLFLKLVFLLTPIDVHLINFIELECIKKLNIKSEWL